MQNWLIGKTAPSRGEKRREGAKFPRTLTRRRVFPFFFFSRELRVEGCSKKEKTGGD